MNAPTSILPPSVAAYADAVLIHMPGCHGAELEARCRLMLARDTAAKALRTCSDDEAGLMQEIQRLGALHALTAPPGALQCLLQAQRSMLRAAAHLGEFVDALQTRETDARGG